MADCLLHIYAQREEHGEAFIIGNIGGLMLLRHAIDLAIEGTLGSTGKDPSGNPLFVSDGEGYEVKVMRDDSPWTGGFWRRLNWPYTAASHGRYGDLINPEDAFEQKRKDETTSERRSTP